MTRRFLTVLLGVGCLGLLCLGLLIPAYLLFSGSSMTSDAGLGDLLSGRLAAPPTQAVGLPSVQGARLLPDLQEEDLSEFYRSLTPGVVSVRVFIGTQSLEGQGAGSGFIMDEAGHVVTNDHVIRQADRITVVFFDGTEALAEVVGRDIDSDLAVVKVEELPRGTRPLPLGDSDLVEPGDFVAAIGNPFRLGGTMTFGVVSAVGRTIQSGTPFSIPQAIQTDAAINPGNSGGPLFNLQGQVIGVNAQIATSGSGVNAGVGFAIPSNIVRRVTPSLIDRGVYSWPWLGVRGTDVSLLIMQANGLDSQRGAYIQQVIPGGPAAEAGLRGTSGTERLEGFNVPVGGDVVLALEGVAVASFADLLALVTMHQPGETVGLDVWRAGELLSIDVLLEARPEGGGS